MFVFTEGTSVVALICEWRKLTELMTLHLNITSYFKEGKMWRKDYSFFPFDFLTTNRCSTNFCLWLVDYLCHWISSFVSMDRKVTFFCCTHLVSIYLRIFFFSHFIRCLWQTASNFILWLSWSCTYKTKQFSYTPGLFKLLFCWHTHFVSTTWLFLCVVMWLSPFLYSHQAPF